MKENLIQRLKDRYKPEVNTPAYGHFYNRISRLSKLEFEDSEFNETILEFYVKGQLGLDTFRLLKDSFLERSDFLQCSPQYFRATGKFSSRQMIQILGIQYNLKQTLRLSRKIKG